MIEKIGSNEVYVRDYTNNFSIKEFIQNKLIPDAFPDIEVTDLNVGFVGIVSEMISQGIEDANGTAALMMNEAFISKAVLPSSIYANAALFNLGYAYAVPSSGFFTLNILIEDILKYSVQIDSSSSAERYIVDKNTKILLGDLSYTLDYDIYIEWTQVDKRTVYSVYYDIDNSNSISPLTNKFIKYNVISEWLVLSITAREYTRYTDEHSITNNTVTIQSDITLRWSGQIAGIDLSYVSPSGDSTPMTMKMENTDPEQDAFVYYRFKDDNTMILSFSNNAGYFMPAFNSKIESTIYTCNGESANFESYDSKSAIPVSKTGENYEYNSSTKMTALCFSGSSGGVDKGDIELLRSDVIAAYNTANALTTDRDLELWFESNAIRYDTKATFFKRRDDFSGRLFSQFIAIKDGSYTYPTNTLTIDVSHDEFDHIISDASGNNNEFIIQPGHLWEYADETDDDGNTVIVRDRVRMVTGISGPARITDEALPPISTSRPFMFTNPFFIKIHRSPTVSANYNYLLNHTSQADEIEISSESFYQFQITQMKISRTLTSNNTYSVEVICMPVVSDDTINYVEGINTDASPDAYPIDNNNLRILMVIKSRSHGETGYIEMTPTELRNNSAVLFSGEFTVMDNLSSTMEIDIDLENTPGMKSLIYSGDYEGRVLIDSDESMIDFAILMKDIMGKSSSDVYDDNDLTGYLMTNRFANAYRDLTLYQPMGMMRSTITFAGSNNDYKVRASMIPFLKYDIPLDDDQMLYFIQAFNDQYDAMTPVLNQLAGNSSIDFKLYNTYGRSENYYIGPESADANLWDSQLLLDNVYVTINFTMCVHDRSLYNQTVNAVIDEMITLFDSLGTGETSDVHMSDMINVIYTNQPNVRYLRFKGFNEHDASKQSIFVKYDSVSDLKEDQLQTHVPEMIRVDSDSIVITEETA